MSVHLCLWFYARLCEERTLLLLGLSGATGSGAALPMRSPSEAGRGAGFALILFFTTRGTNASNESASTSYRTGEALGVAGGATLTRVLSQTDCVGCMCVCVCVLITHTLVGRVRD